MKKLEDIIIKRTFTHKEKYDGGKIKEVIRTKEFPLSVKSINQGLRFVHIITDYFIVVVIQLALGTLGFLTENEISLIIVLLFPIYYTLFEYYFQQTPGKMITGTIVIDNYVQKPGLRICLLRTLIRFVPFEPFSCLGSPSRGWHDKWTNTYVVKKEYAMELQALLNKENEESIIKD
ncbi:MAG: RDD family protein [Bacteroidia bacterium]|nr:RDD family protein [Bacteroidia bacterium]